MLGQQTDPPREHMVDSGVQPGSSLLVGASCCEQEAVVGEAELSSF